MSIDALHKWREKFDKIKMKYWTIESKKTKYGTPNTQSSEQTPKKRSALIYESI